MAKKVSCIKCGSVDISTEWHRATSFKFPASFCSDTCGEHRSSLDKFPKEKREHLHRHCRNCQFEWIDPTKDTAGRKPRRSHGR